MVVDLTSSTALLIDLFCDFLLKSEKPEAESDLIAHLWTRVILENLNKSVSHHYLALSIH
jgi:hypothetical protein